MKVVALASSIAAIVFAVDLPIAAAFAGTQNVERALVLAIDGASPPVAAPGAKAVEVLPEFDVVGLEPKAGDTAWIKLNGEPARWIDTGVTAATAGWIVVYVTVDRFAAIGVEVKAEGEASVWVDGAKQTGKANWRRGKHTVAIRASGKVSSVEITGPDEAVVETSRDPTREWCDYREVKTFGSISNVVISDDGRFVAYLVKDASPGANAPRRLEVFDGADGRIRVLGIGSPPTPLQFGKGGDHLLLRQGDDVHLWSPATNQIHEVLRGEPGLSAIALMKQAGFVVYSGTRGVASPKKDGPRRRSDLREKLSDWPTSPHLFLASVIGDAKTRRRLTLPGDCALDSFALFPDDVRVLWTRSIAIPERPWFETEFHELDLRTGADRVVTTLRMGFENRPGLTEIRIAPDGKRAAFLAPRSELGSRTEVEPNVFDPDLWILDLESGTATNATIDSDVSPEAHFEWSQDGSRLWFSGIERAITRIYSLTRDGDRFVVEVAPGAPFEGAASTVAIAQDGTVASVFSSPDRLAELRVTRPENGGRPLLVSFPNHSLTENRRCITPERFSSFDGDRRFDAWLYRPTSFPGDGKIPLVVYYYGGATPTMYGYSDMHQYLAANGYAVLVVNPRGCGGYGDEWSRAHVADWGEIAGADIVAALDAALAREPRLDGSKVGCYGGSYGGFMTLWLAARYPERFHAAVSLYGISNLVSYFGEGQWGYTYGDQAMADKVPWRDEEYFVKHSPLFHAEDVKAAVLLLHGEVDSNVTITESEQMFTALDLLGKEVELVRFPGEDHGLRGTTDNRIAHREMILDWFDKHLRGLPEAWGARW